MSSSITALVRFPRDVQGRHDISQDFGLARVDAEQGLRPLAVRRQLRDQPAVLGDDDLLPGLRDLIHQLQALGFELRGVDRSDASPGLAVHPLAPKPVLGRRFCRGQDYGEHPDHRARTDWLAVAPSSAPSLTPGGGVVRPVPRQGSVRRFESRPGLNSVLQGGRIGLGLGKSDFSLENRPMRRKILDYDLALSLGERFVPRASKLKGDIHSVQGVRSEPRLQDCQTRT